MIMQFIQEHCVENVGVIESVLNSISDPFEPSLVYNAANDEKLVRTDLRLSEFRTIVNDKLFDEADKLIQCINAKQTNGKQFILHKNDIMHIKYKGGGYFKAHEDYLSVNSNFIEEYSLIVCIKGSGIASDGGRTILKLNDHFSVHSLASCNNY